MEASFFCRIAVTLKEQSSCDQFCGQAGQTCLGAIFNGQDPCTPSGFTTCDSSNEWSNICTCSLPGTSPPVGCMGDFPDGWVCSDQGSVCEVATAPHLAGQSCDTFCAAAGYTCIGASENGQDLCQASTSFPCSNSTSGSVICLCSTNGMGNSP